MKTINKKQYLLDQGLSDDDIRFLVSGVSGRRTCELDELREEEWAILADFYEPKAPSPLEREEEFNRMVQVRNELEAKYEAELKHMVEVNNEREANCKLRREAELKRLRAQVLAIAARCGIHQPDSWQFFNTFMDKRSVLKKPLYRYTLEEMPLLLSQMRGLEENEKKSAKKVGTKAWQRKHGFTSISKN